MHTLVEIDVCVTVDVTINYLLLRSTSNATLQDVLNQQLILIRFTPHNITQNFGYLTFVKFYLGCLDMSILPKPINLKHNTILCTLYNEIVKELKIFEREQSVLEIKVLGMATPTSRRPL